MASVSCGRDRPSPIETMKKPREKIMYVTCIQTDSTKEKPDYLATVDVDPSSPTYSQVIHRLPVSLIEDELHHSGWNSCISCSNPNLHRNRLLLPCLKSDQIYVVDTESDPRAPQLFKTISGTELRNNNNVSAPHTVHCLPSGEVMISTMGDSEGNGKGSFLLLDAADFTVKGMWEQKGSSVPFGYDFWYQPRQNVMVSSEWGAPKAFKKGLDMNNLDDYGHSIHVWDWTTHAHLQELDLGEDGLMPLEVRFLHNPDIAEGFVGCAVGSAVFRFYRKDGTWHSEKVISIPSVEVDGWLLPNMPGVITDILISLDDRFLYISNWVQGDIRQYDISDTSHPKLVGQIYLGGSLQKGSGTIVKDFRIIPEQPESLTINGKLFRGGPQMLQLSLDGKRLYVTNSLFSAWDKMFYPDMIKHGSMMLLIDVDTTNGGLHINKDFCVDFGLEPDGPVLGHEMRYPGGDCTSDIWP